MHRVLPSALLTLALVSGAGCVTDEGKEKLQNVFTSTSIGRPDTMPMMRNKDLPFRYPSALYAQKVQSNVTLRICRSDRPAPIDYLDGSGGRSAAIRSAAV